MSYRISALLTRNLPDVFSEGDPTCRKAAIDEISGEDCVFHEANGIYHGRDEIDHVAGKIKSTHSNFRYQRYLDLEHDRPGNPAMSHYIATKMGIIGFMRGLANDVASYGITANAVLPGLTNTHAIDPQLEGQKRASWEQQPSSGWASPRTLRVRFSSLQATMLHSSLASPLS